MDILNELLDSLSDVFKKIFNTIVNFFGNIINFLLANSTIILIIVCIISIIILFLSFLELKKYIMINKEIIKIKVSYGEEKVANYQIVDIPTEEDETLNLYDNNDFLNKNAMEADDDEQS